MGRKFVRVSLGGVHDEAEIRGHRRTYIGALPGNIIQAIRKAGARNCVMMLDEIDKLGARHPGRPVARRCSRCSTRSRTTRFRDNYLGVPFDLSPRRVHHDRQHARHHSRAAARPHGGDQPRRLHRGREAGDRPALPGAPAARGERPDRPGRSRSPTTALRAIIRGYTREAGVRNLEREIGKALRHAAVRIAEGSAERVRIDAGRPRAASSGRRGSRTRWRCAPACRASPPASPGRRSAATSCSSRRRRMPGKGKLILTGQLGEVMRESAQAALTLVKSRAAALGIDPSLFEKSDIHIHVPAGRDPEGRPERRRRDVHGAPLAADRPHGAQRHRDDRRDLPARPGAAGRRHQGEGGRRRRAPG